MRIAVMGAGGVGGYLGGRLAAAGEDVSFIARGAHLAALQADGLRIESPLGDEHLPKVVAKQDPSEVGPVDLVLFAVKTYDSERAAAALVPLVKPETCVVTLQNGIDSVDTLSRFIPRAQVIGGTIYVTATLSGPGTVKHSGGPCRIAVGQGQGKSVILALGEACKRAEGVDFESRADIETMLWEKFVAVSAFSGATALLRTTIGPIMANDETRAFAVQLLDEGLAVAKASGIALRPDFRDVAMQIWKGFSPESRGSMAVDLDAGRPLELDWLSGRIHKLGLDTGIATPAHSAVYRGLLLHSERDMTRSIKR
jgi:2-dehydropantoate 2-reductase